MSEVSNSRYAKVNKHFKLIAIFETDIDMHSVVIMYLMSHESKQNTRFNGRRLSGAAG